MWPWENGEREYYDLVSDPHQLENGWASLSGEQQQALEKQLGVLRNCAGGEYRGNAEQSVDPIDTTIELENDEVLMGNSVVIKGRATDDTGVARVEVVVRAVPSRHYLGETGFEAGYDSIDATLSDQGARKTDWNVSIDTDPGPYWMSARAFDADGNEDVVIPTVFFEIKSPTNNVEKKIKDFGSLTVLDDRYVVARHSFAGRR